MRLKSEFALLDVKAGRSKLAHHFEKGGDRIPVTIHGFITHQWGNDDGTSIEFGVAVESVDVGEDIPTRLKIRHSEVLFPHRRRRG